MTAVDRPRLVTFNYATLDGRIAFSPSIPSWLDPRWSAVTAGSKEIDFLALHGASVTLEGSNSFVPREAEAASFLPTTTAPSSDDFLPRSTLERFNTWMAVVDGRGRVPWTYTERDGTHVLVLVCRRTPAGYLSFLREADVPYIVAGGDRVDLRSALDRLRRVFGTKTIVSTAGGLLNGALLRLGLVDEVDLQLMPVVLGRPDAPSVFAGYGTDDVTPPAHFSLTSLEPQNDGTVLLRFTRASS
jgi:riboflavin biosynthesis pyrimidine reductase